MTLISPITALCLAALVLTGCATTEADPPGSAESSPPDVPAGQAGACDILSSDDVAAALGNGFGDGTVRLGSSSADGIEWTTTGCSWESDELEVAASIAHGDDFATGFECVEPGSLDGDVTPLEGLGDLAWWTWDDFQGGTGTVIVCRDDTRIEVAVEGPREGPVIDEATTRDGATALASDILASVD